MRTLQNRYESLLDYIGSAAVRNPVLIIWPLLLATGFGVHGDLPVPPEAQVRIYAPSWTHSLRIEGKFERITADSLVLRLRDRPALMAIPLNAITKFEVNRGSNSVNKGARNGALIGAGVGLFAGGLIGAATFRCEEPQNCDPFGETGWVDGFVLG